MLYEDQNLVVMIKRLIPNLLTLCNILSGAAAIISILYYKEYQMGAVWIAVGAFFDLLDGMVARLLHATSPIGADLDSLSDVVTFGLAPALLALCTMEGRLLASGYAASTALMMSLPFLLILPFAAYRLALFNNDTGTSNYFRGLPVPASALLWIGISLSSCACAVDTLSLVTSYGLLLLSCLLMVSRVPMLSLKHLGAQMKASHGTIILIAWGAILVPAGCIYMWLGSVASTLRLAMLLYIIVSLAIGRQIKSNSDAIDAAQQ